MKLILFGAFDRHNLGDLLFPHVAAAMLPGRAPIYAGLADRDLRAYGGHLVRALAGVARELGGQPAHLIHVGGELLTCDAWQAAIMLSPPDTVQSTIARLDGRPREKLDWARGMLGLDSRAPYTVARGQFPCIARVSHLGVGGVDLDRCDPALRDEVLARLATADEPGVRDRRTQAHLAAAGIAARLVPDPALLVAELFGDRIRARAGQGEVASILRDFPHGYLAVQFSADFGDDRTLDAIAAGLREASAATALGVALFRAGAAPWHDELECLRRVAARMPAPSVRVFESLDVWDICALVAASRGYCGSSLHGRIVAMAFALPRVNLRHPDGDDGPTKQSAFAQAWEPAGVPGTVGVDAIAEGLGRARAADAALLALTARGLADDCRRAFAEVAAEETRFTDRAPGRC